MRDFTIRAFKLDIYNEFQADALSKFSRVDGRERCWHTHFTNPMTINAWPIFLNYIRSQKLEFRFNGEQVFPEASSFKHVSDAYFIPIKDELYHHIATQGVALITALITDDGTIVPTLLHPYSYTLYVGYNILEERKVWAAVRTAGNINSPSNAFGGNAEEHHSFRPDLALGVQGNRDSFSFLVEFSPFSPDTNGQLRSLVSSFIDEISAFEAMERVFYRNYTKTCDPDIFVEMQIQDDDTNMRQADLLTNPNNTEETMMEANERFFATHLMRTKYVAALEQAGIGSGLPQKETLGTYCSSVASAMGTQRGTPNFRMLPFSTKLVGTSTVFSPSSVEQIKYMYDRLHNTILQAYGISATQSQAHGVRYKVEGLIYALETESNINRFVSYISEGLTHVYNIMYGADKKLDMYILGIRETIIEHIAMKLKIDEKLIQDEQELEENNLSMRVQTPETECEIETSYTSNVKLVALQRQLDMTDKTRLTVSRMNMEIMQFRNLIPEKSTKKILKRLNSEDNVEITVGIQKIVMKESIAPTEQLIISMKLGIITVEEFIRLERTRLGLHDNIPRADKHAAAQIIDDMDMEKMLLILKGVPTDKDNDSKTTAPDRKKRATKSNVAEKQTTQEKKKK